MGRKINPKLFRIGVINQWNSKWFSRKDYISFLQQDIKIKKFLEKQFANASMAKIDIERSATDLNLIIHTAKPGVIIGRGGQGVEDLKKKIKKQFLQPKQSVQITIQEVQNPNLSAELVGQSIVADLEKRMPFRRAMKQAIGRVEKAEAQGVKVIVAGRLNGAEIARSEKLSSGRLPLTTLRADVDYAEKRANTTYGVIGVKVWIYKGEKFESDQPEVQKTTKQRSRRRPPVKKN